MLNFVLFLIVIFLENFKTTANNYDGAPAG